MRKFVKFFVLLLVVCLSLSLFACKQSTYSGDGDIAISDVAESLGQNYSFVNEEIARKIVYYVNLNLTVTDIKESGEKIINLAKSQGGFLQSSNENTGSNYANYSYVLRIPTEKLDEFLGQAESQGTVNYKTVNSEDITTTYVAATARKNAIEQEIAALNGLELTSTSAILERSKRIYELTAELGALEMQINNYDSLVNYSTVTISLNTTAPEKANVPFGQKIGRIFRASIASVGTVFKALIIAFVASFPYIVIIGAVIALVFVIRFLLIRYKSFAKIKFCKRKQKNARIEQNNEKKEG